LNNYHVSSPPVQPHLRSIRQKGFDARLKIAKPISPYSGAYSLFLPTPSVDAFFIRFKPETLRGATNVIQKTIALATIGPNEFPCFVA